jgi:murein DD-endopeptidase MepM/ murein hydrolase activator NlpD
MDRGILILAVAALLAAAPATLHASPRTEVAAAAAADSSLVELQVLSVEPVEGTRTSSFGWRRDPFNRRKSFHRGVDFRAERGTPVRAAGPGIVKTAHRMGGYGRVVIIEHGLGIETRYAHLRRIHVEAGDFVPAGALVGEVGSSGRATGPHLHFEVRRGGDALDPDLAFAPVPEFASLEQRIIAWMVPVPDADER